MNVDHDKREPFNSDWIEPGLLMIGSMVSKADDIERVADEGIEVIIGLTERSIDDCPGVYQARQQFLVAYMRWTIPDETAIGIVAPANTLQTLISKNVPTMVQCRHGVGRSGTVVGTYLRMFCDYPLDSALQILHRRYNPYRDHHGDHLNDEQMNWLRSL